MVPIDFERSVSQSFMKIVIHFGPPKTGTSTIQHWLTSNTNLLVENGIYYPGHKVDENGVSSGNLTALFERVGDNFSFSHKKFKNELALAEQKGAHTLLFSSEFFMRQLSVIAEAIPEAIFLGFVRFPLETLESTYNQGVKRKANPELLTVGEKPRAPIFEIVGKAVNNIGKKRFELLPFEKSFFVEGDLVKTFLNTLDFHLDIEITRETVNSSYCFEALEVKRWFNRYHFLPILSPLDKFLQGYKKGTSHFSLIPPEKFERVKEHYLTLTREFSDQVGLVGADEFIDKLREKSQKPYRMQQLTSDIFEAVIQDWLDGNPGAGDLLRKFVDLSAPQQPSDQVYFDTIYKLIPSSRSFSALTSALYLDRTTIKAVLNTMNVKKLSSFRRSGINKLSFTSAISKWKFDHFSSTLPVNHQVEWISHHIPKTAGSSLRNSMEQAYGMQAIYGVYRESGAAELNKGRNIWLPAEAKVIHGHFRTHKNQQQYFPNAKRLVWLRDPIERAWSLLGRLLDIKEKDQLYNKLKARYIDKGITEKADLFRAWITDDELNYPLFAYTHYFRQIGIEHFDFVGSMHSMKEDLVRLSNVLDIELTVEHKNVRTGATDLPIEVRQLESYLAKEYAVVGKYLRNK